MAANSTPLDEFLSPLSVDIKKIHSLARSLSETFTRLARESQEQFLPTPISESVLRAVGEPHGRYLSIDIGGTNLRVGFIELLGSSSQKTHPTSVEGNVQYPQSSRVKRHLEKAWPIGEQLKHNQADGLFAWIGKCIAEVVQDGCRAWPGELSEEIPLGVTFSFPMIQYTLSDATLMSMGKGFAISSNLDLGKQLLKGYEKARQPSLPRIKIAAIANDTVATLVAFAYQFQNNTRQKPVVGLIVGTGCNATIPLALNKLHPSKRPVKVEVLDGIERSQDLKIAINTEWTINGAAPPLHELGFVTSWDKKLDAECDAPGFQPFEYMTAGRYLGELGRIIIVDYFTNCLAIPFSHLPPLLTQKQGLTTTFLGNLRPIIYATEFSMVSQLNKELPSSTEPEAWRWTPDAASIVYQIAVAVQRRAAGMTAAAVIGLLACADEFNFSSPSLMNSTNGTISSRAESKPEVEELMVGYTGGCIVHFQDYLPDCQRFLDDIMEEEFGENSKPRVVLQACHDGGIIGAGILAGTVVRLGHGV